ncbi:hypothetical protein Cni_G10969 [Canna indica]|uniref:Uncharacterized protein n=1 Tax=Canna indica TaxID=4628 RepID=A0AAQ3QB74_9LILI|nr:hypothetical protein Cni_G10969 [Canna indica]
MDEVIAKFWSNEENGKYCMRKNLKRLSVELEKCNREVIGNLERRWKEDGKRPMQSIGRILQHYWVTTCRSVGGLGMRDIVAIRKIAFAKKIFSILNEEDHLWVEVLKQKYGDWHPWMEVGVWKGSCWFENTITEMGYLIGKCDDWRVAGYGCGKANNPLEAEALAMLYGLDNVRKKSWGKQFRPNEDVQSMSNVVDIPVVMFVTMLNMVKEKIWRMEVQEA